jgi:hypothetical protein
LKSNEIKTNNHFEDTSFSAFSSSVSIPGIFILLGSKLPSLRPFIAASTEEAFAKKSSISSSLIPVRFYRFI